MYGYYHYAGIGRQTLCRFGSRLWDFRPDTDG
jgi:hypothetical protein